MPLITIRNLPYIGGAGNQLHLYVFSKAYALAHGCELQVPPWWGREVFLNATEPSVTNLLNPTQSDADGGKLGYFFGQKDIDINVYAQHQVYIDFYTRKQCREWLTLKPEYERYAPSKCLAYSAAHLRRGDYVTDPNTHSRYCVVAESSYRRAVKQFNIPQPIFDIFDNWMAPADEALRRGFAFLSDFLFLRDAAYLLRANSTFSWWASTLGHGKTYSPLVEKRIGWNEVEFTEGNHPCTAGCFSNQSDLHLKEE